MLVANKLAIESRDMEWNTVSLIIIYGILAICELANMENPVSAYLIVVSSEQTLSDVVSSVILSSSNSSRLESYDAVTFGNFVKHIQRNKDSKKLIFMLL